MLGTSLSLSSDVATDVDTNTLTFALRAADIGHSEYSVAGFTPPQEVKLTVSHSDDKDGSVRSLVRFDQTILDANLVPGTASVYMVIVRPPNGVGTAAVIKTLVNCLVDLCVEGGGSQANVTALLNREV